jgi:purine-nucleoside phosphorylase
MHEIAAAMDPQNSADEAAEELLRRIGIDSCDAAVVLGSGWGGAASELGDAENEIVWSGIPGFVTPGSPGHSPTVRSMWVGAKRVLVFMGRVHLYEGYGAATVAHAVRVAGAAGARAVALTNAAATLRADFAVGQPVLISDHINVMGTSPLEGGDLLDLEDAYSLRLREAARGVAPSLAEGVYAAIRGPALATPAEARVLRLMGADLVGMSTVPEALAAREQGVEVLGLSLVTHNAAGMAGPRVTGEAVRDVGQRRSGELAELLHQIMLRV